jgi:hypothetical protein
MHKQTVIDQIEIVRDGTIQVRLAKEIVDDDGTVISAVWHRTILPPGLDVDEQMRQVNEHLIQMGWAGVATGDIDRIKQVAPVVWTEAVKLAYASKEAAKARVAPLEVTKVAAR